MAVIVVVAALAFTGDLHHAAGSSTMVLVQKRTQDLIPQGQFDSVVIDAKSASTVNGSVTILFAVIVYTMNVSQFTYYVKNEVVSGYEFTSGTLQNVSPYFINVQVPAGFSYLIFANPLPIQALVGFNSDLTLKPA